MTSKIKCPKCSNTESISYSYSFGYASYTCNFCKHKERSKVRSGSSEKSESALTNWRR